MNFNVGLQLTQLRLNKRITQAEAARKVGISVTWYNMFERGKRQPSLNMIIRICNSLNISSDTLLGINLA